MKTLTYAQQHQARFLAELKEFLRIPSISTLPEHRPDVERAALWLQERLLEAGFPTARLIATAGHPVVYADWTVASDAPTVLIYGHYDVQPPDPLELWHTPPFEPTIVSDDIFARGAADDKGQLYAHVKALECYGRTVGAPPLNVRCIFEGEEESGSPNLAPFIREHAELLAADVAVVSDTHILGKDMPSIIYALRGLVAAEVEVRGPEHDLHSGIYGGAVHNPVHALCEMISRLHDSNGRVTVPGFYDAVRDLSTEERAELARVPFDREAWLREAGVQSEWGDPDYTIIERTTARPTLDVNGIWGGYTQAGTKTVLPATAHAKISMRLVPDQDPQEIAQRLKDYLLRIAPPTVRVTVTCFPGTRGIVVRREGPAMRAASQAYAEVFGRQPVFMRAGGSIPVVTMFQELLGMETILLGFGLPDDRLHAPNEKFHLPNFYRGIETIVRFMAILGQQTDSPDRM
jgi:acetylornithine deacetylase/succinyl-diaminopimelate desuccinylase-like protein